MGLFDKFKKKEKAQQVFQQDLKQTGQPGAVFMMQLLMKEPCEMPNQEKMNRVMQKYLGDVENFCYSKEVAGFAVNKYKVEFKEGAMPVQLMITGCTNRDSHQIDELTKSQMWDCKEQRDRILTECRYQVVATDLLGGAMEYKDRAEMLMDYMEALIELYPNCEAILFQTSGKMFTIDQIREHKIPRDERFIYFAVNVRFFNIQGTDDMLVDTLGMSTLYLPDLQYHFHDMDPNWVINHAYNLLSYMYEYNAPIKDGETIDGIVEGSMDRDVRWKCYYEDSLVQPLREVLDIYMNEHASGQRE